LQRWGRRKLRSGGGEALNPQALTIGFARRFATYKRGDLILKDPVRLAAILNHPQHPCRSSSPGRLIPRTSPGKSDPNINHLARQLEFLQRIVFIEDYDMTVARYLVQGWISG